jgi:hypothetical protein
VKAIAIACCAAITAAACNQRVSVIDSPVAPTAVAPPAAPLPIQPDVATVNLQNSGVTAGDSIRGIVNLLAATGPDGATVSLRSNNDAAIVPATTRVNPGERFGEFTITTRAVPDDRHALIVASTPGRSAVAALTILAEMPMFFSWFADPGEFVGQGGWVRYYPGYADSFSGACERNEIRVQVEGPARDSWSATFRAPEGEPLRTGAYESATRIAANRPHGTMSISGRGRSCDELVGRFVVHQIDLRGDRINLLRLSYEQQCLNVGPPAWLRGELRIVDLPSSSGAQCFQ